ncbi:putative beta-glucuronidase [subsurface metagenome]
MLRILIFILLIISSYSLPAQEREYPFNTTTDINFTQLVNGFKSPPAESHLRCYWWWLNSMATKESITRDLEEMKAKGYGGASIFDAGSSNYRVARKTAAGPVFMSPEWMELYKHAVREAERIGIELSVNTQSGWNPGGPSITPELAIKRIVWSETRLTGGKNIQIALPLPDTNLMYQDVMVQAVRDTKKQYPVKEDAIRYWSEKSFNKTLGWKGVYPLYHLRESYADSITVHAIDKDDIIDISQNFKNGILNWDAPEGYWTIIRYGWTCTGARTSTNSDGWSGLSLDHLNPEAFNLFSKDVILPLISTAQSAGNSVKFLQTDSLEMGSVNWTNNFPGEFRRLRAYDIDTYLPVLTGRIVESRKVSNRFLYFNVALREIG